MSYFQPPLLSPNTQKLNTSCPVHLVQNCLCDMGHWAYKDLFPSDLILFSSKHRFGTLVRISRAINRSNLRCVKHQFVKHLQTSGRKARTKHRRTGNGIISTINKTGQVPLLWWNNTDFFFLFLKSKTKKLNPEASTPAVKWFWKELRSYAAF